VLIPDFRGVCLRWRTVVAAQPDVLNHTPRPCRGSIVKVRGARCTSGRSNCCGARKSFRADATKTGVMLGLASNARRFSPRCAILSRSRTDILTLGQYLQPTNKHLPVIRFVHRE